MPLMRRESDPEKQAAKEAERRDKEARKEAERIAAQERKAAEAFAKTPAGRARMAWHAGDSLFQIALPVASTQRTVMGVLSGDKQGVRRRDHSHVAVLDAIEAEGWRLEHAGYVYEQTGSVSRDKFMSSGQTASVTGRLVGIYIFRATERRDAAVAELAEQTSRDEIED